MSHQDIVSGQDGFHAQADGHDDHDETSPLLPDGSTHRRGDVSTDNDNSSTATTRTYTKVVAGIMLVTLAVVPAFGAMTPSIQRLYELTTCRAYYFKHDPSMVDSKGWVEEKYCKVDDVQKYFAYITGWGSLLSSIPGLIMSIPIGSLADSKGRKLVFANSIFIGYLVVLWVIAVSYFYKVFPNPKFIWVSSVFNLFSGGEGMITAMLVTMLADVTSSRDL
jgi:MFS family permease